MTDAWAPRRVRLKRRVHPGDASIQVYPSTTSGFLAKLGTELVTTGGAGDTWSISPAASQNHHADGYLSEVTIRVVVGGVEHTAVAQHLRHREESPKGELEATWDIYTRTPGAFTPNMDGLPTRFSLLSNEGGGFTPFFGGYIGRVENGQRPNGWHELHIVGRGGFVTAGWQPITTSTTWTADKAEHTVIEDILGLYAPYISSSLEHILDGGLNVGEPLQGIGRNLRYFLDWVIGRGDSAGQVLDWYVRTDTDDVIKLWLIIRTRNPVIEIPISSIKAPVRFVKDYEHTVNYVIVKFSSGFVTASPPGGATGAIRGRYFDYSSRIDNHPLAQQVADMILANANVVEALSDGNIEIDYPNVVLVSGVPFPLHRVRAGWLVNVTGWAGGFSLGSPKQIKQLEADHVAHTLGLSCGRLIEDDLDIGSQYFDKQTKMLGTPGSGLLPLNIAPPEGMPYEVRSDAMAAGASGGLGYQPIGRQADIIQTTYNIDAGRDAADDPVVISPGRRFPEHKIEIGGRLKKFLLTGNDGVRETPGPATIHIEVYHNSAANLPAQGTLVTTLAIEGDVQNEVSLKEAPSTTDKIIEVVPGDYLVYVVLEDVDLMNNVSITGLIQRTGGSSMGVSTGAPTIISASASRDITTGLVSFVVTTNRPAYVRIEYGKTAAYGSFSRWTEFVEKISTVPIILDTPFHWRAIVKDSDNHTTLGTDQTG